MTGIIDLGSDTATKPSPAMIAFMMSCPVGDDQRQEDPTVNALEDRTRCRRHLLHELATNAPAPARFQLARGQVATSVRMKNANGITSATTRFTHMAPMK